MMPEFTERMIQRAGGKYSFLKDAPESDKEMYVHYYMGLKLKYAIRNPWLESACDEQLKELEEKQ